MFLSERHQLILDLLNKNKKVRTSTLIETLHVSEATIRRDLAYMEKRGLLKRYHGGATLVKSPTTEESLLIRQEFLVREKRMMAQKSLDFIKNGNSYFIDSSSTVSQLVPFLEDFDDLTIITNGIHVSLLLAPSRNITTYLLGGIVSATTHSTLGGDILDMINKFNCNAFIFSASGISLNGGITEANLQQQSVKSAMLKKSSLHILIIDDTKFDKIYVGKTCDFSDIDVLITNKKPRIEYLRAFEENNIQLIII